MSDKDNEELQALQTERAYLVENGKTERAAQVDDRIAAVQARIDAAGGGRVETTQAEAPPENTDAPKPRRGRPSSKQAKAEPSDEG